MHDSGPVPFCLCVFESGVAAPILVATIRLICDVMVIPMNPKLTRRPPSCRWLTVLAVLALATAADGGAPPTEMLVAPAPQPAQAGFSLLSDYVGRGSFVGAPEADGDAFGTAFEAFYRIRLGNAWPALPDSGWFLRLGATSERFDFGQTGNLPLPNHLQSIGARLALEYFVKDKPGIFLEVVPSLNFENEIGADSFQVSGLAYVSYPITPSFIAVLGLVGSSNARNPILPAVGFVWTINPEWTAFAIPPRPRIIYSPTPTLQFWAGGEILSGTFRVDGDTGRGENLQNAIVTYRDLRAGAGVTYRGWKPALVELGAGYSFNRKFDYYRAEKGYAIDGGAPFVQLTVGLAF